MGRVAVSVVPELPGTAGVVVSIIQIARQRTGQAGRVGAAQVCPAPKITTMAFLVQSAYLVKNVVVRPPRQGEVDPEN